MAIREGDTPAEQEQRLTFGRFVLDLRRGVLLLDGREVVLRPKTFSVLCYLVQHPSRLVSKDELLAAVWPNLVVTDDTLVQSIGERITAREAASGHEIYGLLHQNLLRKGDVNGRPVVETYHDRIRVAVLGSLDSATRRFRHREIAEEMARASELDHPT